MSQRLFNTVINLLEQSGPCQPFAQLQVHVSLSVAAQFLQSARHSEIEVY